MKSFDETYNQIVRPAMKKKFGYKNDHAVPKILKISVNIGVGQGQTNPKFYEITENTIKAITGQKPRTTLSRKAISGFKLRQGVKIGMQATLRGQRMKDFALRLIHIVLPRMRDFRGLDDKSFDGRGNYSLGIREQIIFPEIKYDQVELTHGLEITIVTSAKTHPEAKELLTLFGFPFKKELSK